MSNQEINKDSVQKFLDSLENTLGTRKIDENCDTTKIIRFQAGNTKYKKAFHYEYNLETKKLGFYVEYKKCESEIFEKLVSYISFCFAEKKDYLNNLSIEELYVGTVLKKWTINEKIESLEKFKERLNDLISTFEPILCGVNFFTPDQGVIVQKVVLKQYEVEHRLKKLEKKALCWKKIQSIISFFEEKSIIELIIVVILSVFLYKNFNTNVASKENDSKVLCVRVFLVDDSQFMISPKVETTENEDKNQLTVSTTPNTTDENKNNSEKETDESSDSTFGGDK